MSFVFNPFTGSLDRSTGGCGGSGSSGGITGTPTIHHETMAAADTEQDYELPSDTRLVQLHAQGRSKIQIAFTSGQSGTTYWTIKPGNIEYLAVDSGSTVTLYFQTSKAGEIVEVLSWV